ncbi:serine/threonine-protein kinase 17A-like [Xyrauchen texanus]|uniref:serine/threonine-protein kinase 17A-like n=1 Tax=Xyrauchen texanus TaxID=154827 RepID=UPI0022419EC0|nr:serine/threonine-protein kinase 17A-like [Xyrauchen texanus]XP_051994860.1 serine/threonine-protein kinase 17A-like [Xyrauchen texanus]
MMNRNGMVTKIRTRIRTDPFKNSYDLVGKELGRGKFAVVKKCVEKTTGKEHAAKFLKKRRKGLDCRGDILNEIAVLESAEANPYVVALHEVYETTAEIILVLECAAGGEIFNQCVADNDEAFTEKDVIRLARQILKGVSCLHQNNVVHLDLKPQNILLTSAQPLGDIRIVDFGLSRRMDSTSEVREILGTPEYVAPEILNYEPISTATDMWSIGVLTYVMLTGESPFLGDNKQVTFLNISQVNLDYSEEVFQGISDLAVDFIQSLLIKNPKKRATAEQCLCHPWLNSRSHHHSVDTPLDEQEASQSESEPESPVLSPELVVMPSYPIYLGQGELKTGRDTFGFSEPFQSRPEIQQELIC